MSRFIPAFADMRVYRGGSALKPGTVRRHRADPDLAPAHPHRRAHLRVPPRAPGRRDVPRRRASSSARPAGWTSRRCCEAWAGCRCCSSPAPSGTTRWPPTCSAGSSRWPPVRRWTRSSPSGSSLRWAWPTPRSRSPRTTSTGSPRCTSRPGTGGLLRNAALGDAATRPPTFLSGGGGLVSTAADYHRFAQMLRRGGELDGVRLLGPRTVRVHDPQPPARAAPTSSRSAGRSSPSRRSRASGSASGSRSSIDAAGRQGAHQRRRVRAGAGCASTAFWVDPAEESQRCSSPSSCRRAPTRSAPSCGRWSTRR